MKRPFIQIIVWLGVMAALTLLALGIWYLACGGSQSTASLKWLQLLQTFGTFLLPPIVCAWFWSTTHQPFTWLGLRRGMSWQVALLAIVTMVCAIPGINLLADLNSRIVLPENLAWFEQWLKQMEEKATQLTERFLQADNVGMLLLNVGLLALLPALAEELSFRGTLQQILAKNQDSGTKIHSAIWVTAFVFSAIHMQFYGFIPRMLMGAMFGYVFVWTGSLWAPILMHFTNNGIAVIVYYLTSVDHESVTDSHELTTNWADTVGSGSMWWLGVLSIIAVCILLYCIRKSERH